jgi:hypothetical protein
VWLVHGVTFLCSFVVSQGWHYASKYVFKTKCFRCFFQNCEKRLLPLSCLSIRLFFCSSIWNNLAATGQMLMKFDIWAFYKNLSKNSSLLKIWQIMDTVCMKTYAHLVICHWILLKMRNVSGKICRENQNTRFILNNFLLKIVQFMRQCGKIWWS